MKTGGLLQSCGNCSHSQTEKTKSNLLSQGAK
jgi:hypothetical protein